MIARLARRLLLEEIQFLRVRTSFVRERLKSAYRHEYHRGFRDARTRFSGLPQSHPDPHRQTS